MTYVALCFSFDVITFDENHHHLDSSYAGGNYLSNDTQIRAIGSLEPEICTKMLRNSNEKLTAKFPVTRCIYSMVEIACSKDAFWGNFELEASPVDQSLP